MDKLTIHITGETLDRRRELAHMIYNRLCDFGAYGTLVRYDVAEGDGVAAGTAYAPDERRPPDAVPALEGSRDAWRTVATTLFNILRNKDAE